MLIGLIPRLRVGKCIRLAVLPGDGTRIALFPMETKDQTSRTKVER